MLEALTAATKRLASMLTYPRTPDDLLELADPLHSVTEIRARVLEVRRETQDVSTLVLRPNARWAGHRAGQHTLLSAEIDGVRRTRCFSIASAPANDRLEITVKARSNGRVTPRLIDGSLAGRVVTLSPPMGDFILPDPLPYRLLFLSGGSGITPVMSQLRHLVSTGYDGKIQFVHFARGEHDVIFHAELNRLAHRAQAASFRGADRPGSVLRPRSHRSEDQHRVPALDLAIRYGHFTPDAMAAIVEDHTEWQTFACGPRPMMDLATLAYRRAGKLENLHAEEFALADAAPSATDGAAGDVVFRRSGRRGGQGRSLLAMAESLGVDAVSGCRRGICHTCLCRKLSGTTIDLRTGEASTDSNVDIQLCVSAPVGPVVLDL